MLEVQAPIQRSRNSRYSKALKTRFNKWAVPYAGTSSTSRQRLRALDEVKDVSVAIGKEHQAVPLVLERLSQEIHASAF
jgi:hypothetical protein